MSECKFPKSWLMAWLDGEAGKRAAQTRDHLEKCPACANEIDGWRRAGDELRQMVDSGLEEIEPLDALSAVRQRIEARQRRSLMSRVRQAWDDLWLMHRRALTGVAAAAALGALVAPGAVYLLGRTASKGQLPGLAVIVESLEVGDNSTAMVLGNQPGTTTLIWVEPAANEINSDESL